MIVKYRKDDVLGYIDNVRQAAVKEIDCKELIQTYNDSEEYKDETHSGENDIAGYMEGKKLPDDVADTNKVFLMATKNQKDWGREVHGENFLDPELMKDKYPAYVVLMYVEEHKEYDGIIFVTNQRCFLMNDKGQTVERLV